ncbi:MAG TPA: DUF4268 domain-containing protein [Chitinophagaceae bacterium]|nr:DUF4268 domain-containing protein [Chitinophagaceae bacterium]
MRRNFWTSFGQYMRPLPGADGMAVNWLNYKTGIRQLYFRMDADKKQASVAIEMRHSDMDEQDEMFKKFETLKKMFLEIAGTDWDWELHSIDEDSKPVSRIITRLQGVNIFNEADWPAIISFLKPRMIALDQFWHLAKDHF